MPADYRLLMRPPRPGFTEAGGTLSQILNVADEAQKFKREQQEAQESRAINQVLTQFADDPDEAVMQLRRSGMHGAAMKLGKELEAQKKAIFETRKSQLEGLRLEGQITAEQAKAEREAMEAESPEKMLAFIAGAQDQNQLDNGLAMMRLKFGKKADPVIAKIPPTYTPEFGQFVGRMIMGPKDVATLEGQEASRAQAAAIAEANRLQQAATAEANRATTERGQDISASTQRRGQDLSATTTRRGQDMTDARAKAEAATGTGGAKLSAVAIEKVAGIEQSLAILSDLETLKKDDWLGPVQGRFTEYKIGTPGVEIANDLAKFAAQTATLKNAVVKAVTGAAMSEPEAKRIMNQIPTFTDKPNVWKQKLIATRENLATLRKRTIELSGGTVTDGAAPKKLTAEELIKKYGGG